MEIWMVFIVVSIIAVILEIVFPSLFCINFAFAGLLTAFISLFWGSWLTLTFVFLGISLVSILFIKPLLSKTLKIESSADFKSEYVGKIVKTIEPVNSTSGAVTIYDERWEARTVGNAEEIPSGCDVKIVSNDSLTLFVEKI